MPMKTMPWAEMPDPRLVFLYRASARLTLVYSADMDLDEAVAGLVAPFEQLVGRRMTCDCEREIAERLERGSRSRRSNRAYPSPRSRRGVAA